MVVEEEGGGNDRVRWGTWEELVLGGAVLRHGSLNWEAVAKEFRTRTLYPYLFSPKVCKAKYEALQERYSGCSAWVEELRKRRVEELRRALEMSDDSIGSLETKLVSLKSDKGESNNAGYSCSVASPVLYFRSGWNESSGKEASKDGSSAGSFTHESETTWSKQSQPGTIEASVEETEKTPVVLETSRLERFPSIDELAETMLSEHGVSIKRRRGKRRRKDSREASVGENNVLSFADIMPTSQGKEKLTIDFDQPSRAPGRPNMKRRQDLREASVGENNVISSANILMTSQCNENLTSYFDKPSGAPRPVDQKPVLSGFGPGQAGFGPVHTLTTTQGTSGFKKRRKELSKNVKEGRTEENKIIFSDDILRKSECKEKPASGSRHPSTSRVTDANCVNPCTSKQGIDDFTVILESIMENEHASIFRRRLDSQKRARYRSIVRQHMDLDTIRSRIAKKSIKSVVQLFRDLLLVANNSLIFYSRMTREYKCALVLRDLVTKRLHEYYKTVGNKVVTAQIPKPQDHKPPAKPRSARPFNRKPVNKEACSGNIAIVLPKEGKHVSCNVGSPSSAESSALTKKSPGRRGKVGRVKRGSTGIQAETPMKVRKKVKDTSRKAVNC